MVQEIGNGWREGKTAIPWGCYQRYLVLNENSDEKDFILKCKFAGCSYFIGESGLSSKDIRNRAVQHLEKISHLGGAKGAADRENDSGYGDRSQVSFVKAVLQSMLPYTQFTRVGRPVYDLLKTNDFPGVVSDKTFRKLSKELAHSAIKLICEKLEQQLIHWSMDTSPALDRTNYVSINAHFISDCSYQVLNLGVTVAQGLLSAVECEAFTRGRLQDLDLDFVNFLTSTEARDVNATTVISGVSDMGPGFSGSNKVIWGAEGSGDCTAHAMNILIEESGSKSQRFQELRENLKSLFKILRRKPEIRAALERVKQKIPDNQKNIRWNRASVNAGQFHENQAKFDSIQEIKELSEYSKVMLDFPLLEQSRKIYSQTDKMMTFLQGEAPMGALVIPLQMLMLLNNLNKLKPEFAGSPLKDALECLTKRICRRFFFGVFDKLEGSEYCFGESDKTRKRSMFDRIWVLVAWGLSPKHTFKSVELTGLATSQAAKKLQEKADAAILRVHKWYDPAYFETTQFPGACDIGFGRDEAPLTPDECHRQDLERFRNQHCLGHALETYGKEVVEKPISARNNLLQAFLVSSAQFPYWIQDLLRMSLSYPMVTAQCERDFNGLQQLLDAHRLRLGPEMTGAYLLAKTSPNLMQIERTENQVKKVDTYFGSESNANKRVASTEAKPKKVKIAENASKDTKVPAKKTRKTVPKEISKVVKDTSKVAKDTSKVVAMDTSKVVAMDTSKVVSEAVNDTLIDAAHDTLKDAANDSSTEVTARRTSNRIRKPSLKLAAYLSETTGSDNYEVRAQALTIETGISYKNFESDPNEPDSEYEE